jgi:hypothetical protein
LCFLIFDVRNHIGVLGHEESRTAPESTALAPGAEALDWRRFARERLG